MPKIRIVMLLAIIVILAVLLISHRGSAEVQAAAPAPLTKPDVKVSPEGDNVDVKVEDLAANVELADLEIGDVDVEMGDMDFETHDMEPGGDEAGEIQDKHDEMDDDSASDLRLKEQETIRKTFTLNADHRTLDVDNVNGSIEVVAVEGNQVQMVVNKTLRAESKDKMEIAKKEVKLDITEQPDLLKLYVDGPFRCNCNDGCNGWHGDRGYSVNMDFQLQVPRTIDVRLKTVNGGHVNVKGVSGTFSVHNVNGRIDMQEIAGSGQARTVNGGLKVGFRENPKQKSDFNTVNGNVELTFVRGLSADFRMKTFNGSVYTDYEMTSLPSQPVSGEQRNGKFVFRSNRFTSARVGNGGPEIKAENLNGDIRILEGK